MRPKNLQLAAIDLDGTLLRENSTASVRSCSALKSFESFGTLVFASGQPPSRMLKNVAEFGVKECYCIASNGATIVRAPAGNIVYKNWCSARALDRLIPQIRDALPDLRLTIEATEGWFTSSMEFFSMLDRILPGTGTHLRSFGVEVPLLEEAFAFRGGQATGAVRLLGMHPDQSEGSTNRLIQIISPIIQEENALYGSDLALDSPGGSEGCVQIMPSGVDKSKALQWVCNGLGLSNEGVVAFGDHLNDISMLQWAGWGVVMGNAIPNVKKYAQEVTLDNERDGVAVVLEEICGSRVVEDAERSAVDAFLLATALGLSADLVFGLLRSNM